MKNRSSAFLWRSKMERTIRGPKLLIWITISTNSNRWTCPISSNQVYQDNRSFQELKADKKLPQARDKPKVHTHCAMELEVASITYKSVLLFILKTKLLMITRRDQSLQAFLTTRPIQVIGEPRRFKTKWEMLETWEDRIIIPHRMSLKRKIC